jgi:glycosyltransferase involved in cell wall biosynthesis
LSPQVDVIYGNTWPIFAQGILALVAKIRRVPLILSIQDVYPESLCAQGRLSNRGMAARILRSIDAAIARTACSLVVLSIGFSEIYERDRGVPNARIHIIPNWGDGPIATTDEMNQTLREELGISQDAFVLVYGGNISMAANVEGVIRALDLIEPKWRPKLLIAGEGACLEQCRRVANLQGHQEVFFYSPWPSDKTEYVYSVADAFVLPTRGSQSLASVPSKLISYMLAKRPVIAQGLPDSDLAETILRAKCGWTVEPDNPQALADIIKRVRLLPADKRDDMGRSGQEYALTYLTAEACIPRLLELFRRCIE